MQLAALFLAGLSLFFTGVSGVKAKLQQLSSRKFRQLLARVTDRPLLAGAVGLVFGAVTQSASAVAFILAGMVATGLITLRRALPVVAASNVGTALLVFLAAFDLRLAVLLLVGITGLMINFRILARAEAFLGALFAIGMLFLGLDMMKQAFAPLPGFDWFTALASFLKTWPWAPFFLGAALRMVIQSSSAIGVVAIALEGAGLFTEFQAILLICGAGPGVGLAAFFLSGTLHGPPRQIVLFQGIINLVAGSALAASFYVGETAGHGLVTRFIGFLSPDPAGRIAWAFFLNMNGCFLAGLILAPFTGKFLHRLAPPTEEQDLSRPAFIHDEALDVPDTAVVLVDREQQRLFGLGLRVLNAVREDVSDGEMLEPETFRAASKTLDGEISGFLKELINRDLTSRAAASVLLNERRQENLAAMAETVFQFVVVRKEKADDEKLDALMDRMSESLHLILLTAQDAWASRDKTDIEYLLMLSADRGEVMERIRKTYQLGETSQDSVLFYATTLFERMVWIVRQIGLSLQRERD